MRKQILRKRIGGSVVAMVSAAVWIALLGGCPLLDLLQPPAPPDTAPKTGNSGLTGKFVGSQTCQTCHSRIHANWSETLHGQALETLEKIGQDKNAACLPCHTVGYGQAGGFVDRATTNDLAGVGCEACHGAARDHINNVSDESLRPTKTIAAETCGACHTGSHHPNFEDWSQSPHAKVTGPPANSFNQGRLLNTCGKCHSGDFFYRAILNTETVLDTFLQNVDPAEMHAVECAICHNPHARTGNAPEAEDGRDYQLRFPEVASPVPTNTIDAATNASRFNICGQCHHSRGRTWVDTSRPPHHSVQANVFAGEMPVPEDSDVLVLSRTSIHSFAREQCATCHMFRQDFQDERAPAISGHTFAVNNNSCSTSGCHISKDASVAAQAALQAEVQAKLDDIAKRLGDASTWEYSSEGGPSSSNQAAISDEIKKIRFLYHYVLSDGSLGVHNPAYVRDILAAADKLLTSIGR